MIRIDIEVEFSPPEKVLILGVDSRFLENLVCALQP